MLRYLATESATKNEQKGFCNTACQNLLVGGALWMSAIVGFVSFVLVAHLIRRNFKSYTVPAIQEKLMSTNFTFQQQCLKQCSLY